jgi:transglutaminase-like putative cysteine protease
MAVAGGLLAVAMLGGVVGLCAGLCAIGCLPSLVSRPLFQHFPWPLLTLAGLVALAGWAVGGAAPQDAVGVALIYLMLHRVVGRSSETDDRVAALLAGLMLVASASHTESPLWLMAWAMWALGLPLALLPGEVRGGSKAAMGLIGGGAVVCALGAVLVFPLMPRLHGSQAGEMGLTGFTTEVELGALDALLDDPGEVFRVQTDGPMPGGQLYFRGVALDRFDGRRWESTEGAALVAEQPTPTGERAVVLEFSGMAPEGALFTAGQVVHVEAPNGALRRDRHGAYRVDVGVDATHEWVVVATAPWDELGVVQRGGGPRPGEMLDLPRGLDARVASLAGSIAGGETDHDQLVRRVSDYLRDNYSYTRTSLDAGAEDPLERFLFDRRSGHCGYFSSAAAVLLRKLGVPTRVVNGFVGGESDPITDGLIVRRYHAHSWVEAWVDGVGWVRVDATPGPGAPVPSTLAQGWLRAERLWEQDILGFDRSHQRTVIWSAGSAVETSLLRREPKVGRPLLGLLVLWSAAVLLAIVLERVVRRMGRRLAGEWTAIPKDPIERAWHQVELASAGLGLVPPPALPILSAARWLSQHGPMPADDLEELAWLYYRVRHGGEASGDHAERAGQLADQIVRAARARATS